jgi:hypothetical protein
MKEIFEPLTILASVSEDVHKGLPCPHGDAQFMSGFGLHGASLIEKPAILTEALGP